MKILVICQYYYPEPFSITNICEELVKRGHEVTVVTGIPNYPMGKIYEGYRGGKKRDEVIGEFLFIPPVTKLSGHKSRQYKSSRAPFFLLYLMPALAIITGES